MSKLATMLDWLKSNRKLREEREMLTGRITQLEWQCSKLMSEISDINRRNRNERDILHGTLRRYGIRLDGTSIAFQNPQYDPTMM